MVYRTACAVFVAFVFVSLLVTRPGLASLNIIAVCFVGFASLCLYVFVRLLDLRDRQRDTLRVSALADQVIRDCVREALAHRASDWDQCAFLAECSAENSHAAFAIARRWS